MSAFVRDLGIEGRSKGPAAEGAPVLCFERDLSSAQGFRQKRKHSATRLKIHLSSSTGMTEELRDVWEALGDAGLNQSENDPASQASTFSRVSFLPSAHSLHRQRLVT